MTLDILLAQLPLLVIIVGYAVRLEHRLTVLETKLDRLCENTK